MRVWCTELPVLSSQERAPRASWLWGSRYLGPANWVRLRSGLSPGAQLWGQTGYHKGLSESIKAPFRQHPPCPPHTLASTHQCLWLMEQGSDTRMGKFTHFPAPVLAVFPHSRAAQQANSLRDPTLVQSLALPSDAGRPLSYLSLA